MKASLSHQAKLFYKQWISKTDLPCSAFLEDRLPLLKHLTSLVLPSMKWKCSF